jgi:hypothetical protein
VKPALTAELMPSAAQLLPSAPVSSWRSLGGLIALTRLELVQCRFEGCCDVCALLASQLAHLTRLRAVVIDLQGHFRILHEPYTSAGAAALVSQLQQLTNLTQLRLALDPGSKLGRRTPGPVLSSLTQLCSVDLVDVGTPGQPLDLATLPGSLTGLCIQDCDVSYADTSSSTSGSAVQLPLLQKLDMWSENTDPCLQKICLLLRQAPALSKLDFTANRRDGGSFLDRAAGMLSQLQSLQHIEMHIPYADNHHAEAAQLAALASCSQLTSLVLSFWRPPAGAVQQLFPAGRQLQRCKNSA